VPDGWRILQAPEPMLLEPGEERELPFRVVTGAAKRRRARVAVDVTIGALRLGQHSEALVDVE